MTKTTTFKKHNRFDAERAATGVPHRIVDELGNYYGTFTTSLFDPTNKFLDVANQRFRRKAASDPSLNGKHAHVFAFVNVCMHNWAGVLDTDDKEVPFSHDAAFQLLSDEDNAWLLGEIIQASKDVTNYRGDPEAEKADVAGN